MKPPTFAYHRATSVQEAVEVLGNLGSMARPISGGQSLVPMLNMRLVRPRTIVDVNAIPGLSGIDVGAEEIRIGALTRHSHLERSRALAERVPVLSKAVRLVGDRQIRTRGTIGGSLAHGDPTAELAVAAVALNAQVVAEGPTGRRMISAESLYNDAYTTQLEPNEIITEVRIPHAQGRSAAFVEHTRRHGDFAVLSVAVVGRREPGGDWRDLRIALGGLSDTPVLAVDAAAVLEGTDLPEDAVDAACEACVAFADPDSDVRASAEYRLHLAPIYVRHALREIAASGTGAKR